MLIVGELIGIIFLVVTWSLFIIGVFGIRYEFRDDWKYMNDGWTMAFIFFVVYGGVVGSIMLTWFLSFTGIGDILGLMWDGFWNMVI